MRTLDLRGKMYTMAVVKLASEMKKTSPDERLEVINDYTGFEAELRLWCKNTGNVLEDIRKSGDVFTAIIRKE